MAFHKNNQGEAQKSVRFKKSMLAMCIMALGAPSFAQDAAAKKDAPAATQDEAVETIIVSGTRAALESAQEIKKKADTFVDAISATDIGALPDKSVLEALQRVPGISISRFASAEDPDHFSIEGSGITLRGMPQTLTQFNGRDSFSANSAQGLSFQDVPPELMSKVEVFKNQTADMTEGGISGSINLATRKPFDASGRLIAFNAAANYGDLSKETKPSLSGLYSDRWETGAGEFGFLVSVAASKLTTRSDNMTYGQVANNPGNGSGVGADKKLLPTQVTLPDGSTASRYVPINAAIGTGLHERERDGGSLVGQWTNPEKTLTSTFEYFRSKATRNMLEHIVNTDDASGPISDQVYNDSYMTQGMHDNVDSYNISSRYMDGSSTVEDYSLNFVYTPTDELTVKADFQHVKASSESVDLAIYADAALSDVMNFSDEKDPKVTILAPKSANGDNVGYLTNPANYYWRAAMDHVEENSGDENAAKLDAKYALDSGILKSVETGVRFSDRQQNTAYAGYNWGKMSENWDGTGRKYFDGIVDTNPWDGQHGNVAYDHNGPYQTLDASSWYGSVAGNKLLAPADSLVKDYNTFKEFTTKFGYKPENARDNLIPGSIYKLNELNNVTQKDSALYVKLNFGNESETVSGNVGLRYVRDEITSLGGATYAATLSDGLKAQMLQYYTDNGNLAFYNEQLAWHDGHVDDRAVASRTYTKLLPSFNIKYSITDDLVSRFGVSQAISYPNMGVVRNYSGVYSLPGVTTNLSTGKVTNITWEYKGNSGSPQIKPMEATNWDASIEWYFGKSSSVFAGVFYKDMKNFFAGGVIETPITNNGVTRVVSMEQPINIGKAKISGFEMGYQQFYDMLPAPFDGFGTQFNITLLDQSGDVPPGSINNNPPNPDGSGGAGTTKLTDFGKLPLQGMSDTTYNFVAMYEKDNLSARIAWNWRSEYLITTRDVITGAPMYSQASGQMDASVFYNVTDEIKVGLEGSNLLNEVTWTKMQMPDDAHTKIPRNYFVNDRRISFVVKGQF